ncbi:Baculoviral IAP repeat-containing protein 5.2-A [Pseudolycoriella hygida]|uniref:Baculoviral IAP repeat-containing protein 5.2-A n=1 Tax=Pseudolycoriella hygida TaxID=35572 RepID=A0A9Q0NFV0_9DIPT|nr:Baculoviral IAP repeat-containing protein 5.2-A [Pseudolycoriella hygida]
MLINNSQCYYLFEEERLDSFKTWVFDDKQACNKFALAAAGFYKCKPGDAKSDDCACFFCGKTLSDWDPVDDPFKEHASHSPQCKFITLGRPQSELKMKELVQLCQLWCENKLNKAMEMENERRQRLFTQMNANIDSKLYK